MRGLEIEFVSISGTPRSDDWILSLVTNMVICSFFIVLLFWISFLIYISFIVGFIYFIHYYWLFFIILSSPYSNSSVSVVLTFNDSLIFAALSAPILLSVHFPLFYIIHFISVLELIHFIFVYIILHYSSLFF